MADETHEEATPEPEKSQVVYHTQIPMDMQTLDIFIPDILVPSGEAGKAYVAVRLQEAMAMFLTQHVQPYVMVSESRGERKNAGDGVMREGRIFVLTLAVGTRPIVQTPSGESIHGGGGLKLISTGKN